MISLFTFRHIKLKGVLLILSSKFSHKAVLLGASSISLAHYEDNLTPEQFERKNLYLNALL